MPLNSKASQSGEGEEQAPRMWRWILKRWPYLFVWSGVFLFWLACINSERLPVEALCVGPALMLAGVIMIERNKRDLW
jgi:hypothetical protein